MCWRGHTMVTASLQLFDTGIPSDVLVNVSASEGIPVSIMEAQSCSIPVVATAVGGVPEIVTEQNGRLLGENPTPSEIAESLAGLLEDRELRMKKRRASRQMWSDKYNADRNFHAFAESIISLVGP